MREVLWVGWVAVLVTTAGCGRAPKPVARELGPRPQALEQSPTRRQPPRGEESPSPVASVTPAPDDPLHGNFSLADATQGLVGSGPLVATIDTELGKLECKLYDDRAPVNVANFIGLARGKRPWKNRAGNWVEKPAYDGTTFHRIFRTFMIQGGDPNGDGTGEPGYPVPDEPAKNALYDRAGLLCMANRADIPNSSGMQFFITDGPAPHLDHGNYGAIIGECAPDQVVRALASVEVSGDRPLKAPMITSIKVRRESR